MFITSLIIIRIFLPFFVPCTCSWCRFLYSIALLTLAFSGSIGMTFLIIACAWKTCWWPMIVLVFYVLAPIPTLIARRQINTYGSGPSVRSCMDFAIFLTMGIVVSSFALPIIFARSASSVISPEACYLTMAGNFVIYLTYLGFFLTLFQDDGSYTWGGL